MLDKLFAWFESKIDFWETRFGTKICPIYFLIQTILIALVNFLIKFLSNVPALQMIYLRSVLVYLFNFSIMTELSIDPYPEDQRKMRFLITRGAFNYFSTLFYVISIKILSIMEATTLFYTFSIWIGFLGWFLVKEKVTRYEVFASLFGFAGIMFVVRPSYIFGFDDTESSEVYLMNFWGIVAGLASAICFTVLFFMIKRTKTQLNILIYNQINNLCNLVITPIGVFYQGWYWIGWAEAVLIILMGFLHYGSQLCFIRGMQLEKSGKTSYVGYLQIPIAFGLDLILGVDLVLTSIIGGAIVFLSSFFLFIKPNNDSYGTMKTLS